MPAASETLLKEIILFCSKNNMAESTFGRLAINDGKLCSRLKSGKDVTLSTSTRIRDFINQQQNTKSLNALNDAADQTSVTSSNSNKNEETPKKGPLRFYDNRQNYLSFINTTNEKWKVAERAAKELTHLKPNPPALRLFDAGMGDASILTHLMRALHRRNPIMPFFIVAKEISLEDVRLSLK